MTPIPSHALDSFARGFRWPGSRLRRIRFSHRKGILHADLVIVARDQKNAIKRLHLRLVDVEECRVQKRLSRDMQKLNNVRFAFLQGQYWLTCDEWSVTANERPAVHDFRGTDVYFAARDLEWEEIAPQ